MRGQLRFGDKYQPIARLDAGFQGVSHHSRFIPNGGAETDGPDVSFEFDMVVALGVGFDIWFSDHWKAGATLTGGAVAKNMGGSGVSGSFEGGLYLGYAWKP